MEPKSFEQWKLDNADLIADFEANPKECAYCVGMGECQCECGHVHECRNCDGTGKINRDVAQGLYQKYLAKDKEKLEQWNKVVLACRAPSPTSNATTKTAPKRKAAA